MLNEWVIVNDEGVVEGGFFSKEDALAAIRERYSPEDDLSVDLAEKYDADGYYIEES